MTPRPPLTVGQVCRFTGFSPRTVAKFVDTGLLKGFRVPGSQDRRIPRASFLAFLTANQIPDDAFKHFEQSELAEVSE
jgi:two-component system response regulator RpaA